MFYFYIQEKKKNHQGIYLKEDSALKSFLSAF